MSINEAFEVINKANMTKNEKETIIKLIWRAREKYNSYPSEEEKEIITIETEDIIAKNEALEALNIEVLKKEQEQLFLHYINNDPKKIYSPMPHIYKVKSSLTILNIPTSLFKNEVEKTPAKTLKKKI